VAISDQDIREALAVYLDSHPEESIALAEPLRLLAAGSGFVSRATYPLHVTLGALLVRAGTEILLIRHRAYGLTLQPGGHAEPDDPTLVAGALRELAEETGLDPAKTGCVSQVPAYVEYGMVPPRPEKNEPAHYHLDIGFLFATDDAEIGQIQLEEVNAASWHPLSEIEERLGPRIARAVAATYSVSYTNPRGAA
jgi:8-oxo-dGTP pyrophosphatase MutT (NUDIX family)